MYSPISAIATGATSRTVISVQRQIVVVGRVLLLASRSKTAWVLGTACLGMAKILENMEIGHNVMHGQWDWMNDPDIHSSVWDWDTASTAEAWKHSHNYIHHTYTNILRQGQRSRLRDHAHRPESEVGTRGFSVQPLYNMLLMLLFEWGVAIHDMDIDAIRTREKPWSEVRKDLRGIGVKARAQIFKDYLGWPLISAGAFALAQLASARPNQQPAQSRLGKGSAGIERADGSAPPQASSTRCCPGWKAPTCAPWPPMRWPTSSATYGRTPSSSAAISPTRPTPSARKKSRTKRAAGGMCASWSGAANIDGSPLFHVISGNLGYQVEHHLYPDMPSSRYSEIAPQGQRHLRALRAALQLRPVLQAVVDGAPQHLPVGISRWKTPAEARALPEPRSGQPGPQRPSEGARFRDRVPAEHPAAGPEHESTGV